MTWTGCGTVEAGAVRGRVRFLLNFHDCRPQARQVADLEVSYGQHPAMTY